MDKTTVRPALSIIIPAYNEQDRIGATLESIRGYANRTETAIEVIVVDDGSADETARRIDGSSYEPVVVRLIRNDGNRGKGYSVRRGMLAAAGETLLMMDADRSVAIDEFEKLEGWLDRGYDVVIGSRDQPDSVLDPPQPLWRRIMATVFRTIRRRLLLPELRDTQCGFKCFSRFAARDIFAHQTIDGWTFDCEVLGLADRLGYRTREVGVHWRNDPDSRVRPWRAALPALCSLLAIRRRLRSITAADARADSH